MSNSRALVSKKNSWPLGQFQYTTIYQYKDSNHLIGHDMDVDDDINNGFGELPDARGNGVQHAKMMGVLVSTVTTMIIYSVSSKDSSYSSPAKEDFLRLFVVILAVYTTQLIKSLYLVFEEKNHIETRYGRSWKRAFQACSTIQSKNEVGRVLFIFDTRLLLTREMFFTGNVFLTECCTRVCSMRSKLL